MARLQLLLPFVVTVSVAVKHLSHEALPEGLNPERAVVFFC